MHKLFSGYYADFYWTIMFVVLQAITWNYAAQPTDHSDHPLEYFPNLFYSLFHISTANYSIMNQFCAIVYMIQCL